ncbi:diguanylate cyclase domain-containing protein [Pararhizobium sp. DWP3-4]|uniref:sensor domain-containing diguanylate cyclase n=1 Tax=Pararhizobium sp. DWP3-4 TaxID=2804565 RepID=UPI003CEB114A
MAAGAKKRTSSRAVLGIHTACTLVALLIVASLAFVLNRSVTEADRFGLTAERKLVESEMRHQVDAVVQYQAGLSYWDKSFAELEDRTFTDAFVRQELTDWLWRDFGFSWMIFADASGRTLLAVENGRKVDAGTGGRTLKWVEDLIDKANDLYEAALIAKGGGWALLSTEKNPDVLAAPLPNIHAADLRMIDGSMSIVVVQAVVPKTMEIPAGRRKPVFMITVKPFSGRMIRDMEDRLGISNLGFIPLRQVAKGFIQAAVSDCSQPACMVAAWTPRAPGSFVRSETLPSVIVIAMLAALTMAFIAARFGAVFSALQDSEAENRHLAKHDRLTGVLNRSGFDDVLHASLAKVKERPFSLLCLDLDTFKVVNDTYGHPAGDAVLKTLAASFADRVAGQGFVARLGGDEFTIIVNHTVSHADVMTLANALIADAQVPVPFEGHLLRVGSSVGVAFAPEHGNIAREIVPLADQALYLAKNRGRNRVQTADDLVVADRIPRTGQAA